MLIALDFICYAEVEQAGILMTNRSDTDTTDIGKLIQVIQPYTQALATIKLRISALFFTLLLLLSCVAPAPIWAATDSFSQLQAKNKKLSQTTMNKGTALTGKGPHKPKHKTSIAPSIGHINYKSPPAPTILKSTQRAAADAIAPLTNSGAAFVNKLISKPRSEPLSPATKEKTSFQPQELVQDRTATSSDYLNTNGTVTRTQFMAPHFYKKDGKWATISNTLSEDKNAGDSGNIFGKAWGKVESWFASTKNFTVTGNDWITRFSPSRFEKGMVRIEQDGEQVGFSPVSANNVSPVIVNNQDGSQTVHYYNLWKDIDVEYRVESDQVKEAIVLKSKDAASQIHFKIIGANLQGIKTGNGNLSSAFKITGALHDKSIIAPSLLFLNNSGPVANDISGLKQDYQSSILTISVSNPYIQKLPSKVFPAVIDPTVYFGNRSGGNYESFETNGYNCASNICDPYAGSLYDSNNNRQYWRSAIHVDYSMFQNTSTTLQSATLHLSQRTGTSWWTGYTGTFNYQIGHATCLTGYNCMDGTWDSASIGASGDINATNLFQDFINTNDWGAWVMIAGDDGSALNWKAFDPDNSYVVFTYDVPLSAPTFVTPIQNQVFTDAQASFRLNTETNPNNSTPLQYVFRITTGANNNGLIIQSGNPQNSTAWTVPDGVLQDGSTYYIQGLSYDASTGITSPWSSPVPFRIDTRQGQDKTQTYDTLGPVSVDLATGNLTTGIASHATKALAGDLGVGLTYNSPLKSRPGLVGSYWNQSGGGSASSPDLQRVDQNVDFDWQNGSPSNGTINNTYFEAQWSGYFVAPTTGTYYFGAVNDDSLEINVDNQQVYTNSGCFSGPCYGSSVYLTAGQVVPFQATYSQGTGSDYAHIYVKGPVSQQIVPKAWLQTGVRAVEQDQGLIGHYYTYTDNGSAPTFPTNGTGLFLTRTDPVVSFDWGSGSPIPYGPTTNFMARWTGFITVPTTGDYTFGTTSDDGSRVTLAIGGTDTTAYDKWYDSPGTTGYGSPVTLNAGQSYPITVDYYQHGGASTMSLLVKALGGNSQVVPSSWLSAKAQVLPDGWNLGIDPDGSATYKRLTANENDVILSDSSGNTHDYSWTGSGYKPPTNEYGSLIRNNDGTFTLQDSDGKTYVFDNSGTLTSMTNPADDTHPAALQYTYGSVYTGGPVTIQRIADGVSPNRYAQVYYSGASQCASAPSGFYTAPTNMLCAVQTNDGRTTYFYYDSNGNLAEVSRPGNEDTTYQYQTVYNADGAVAGYQLTGIRTSLANDAVVAGERDDDETSYTQISYDSLGRAVDIMTPETLTGGIHPGIEHKLEYLPGTIGYQSGNPATGYFGAAEEHVVGSAEPNGYTERIEYDNLFRVTKAYNALGLASTLQWDATKDLAYSTTEPTGLMTTRVYDDDDRPVSQYGPAPSSWFNSDGTPQAAYASQVAHTDATYDNGMTGLAVSYMPVTEPSANNASLVQAPLLHSTNIASDGTMSHDWSTTSPIPNYSGDWGFSMTGKMRLPTAGNWGFSIYADEGVRMWIDNQLVIDNWKDNTTGSQIVSNTEYRNFTVANSLHDVRIDYYHLTSSTDASFTLAMADPTNPKGSFTDQVAQYFTPNYGLTTTATSYDSTYGNSTVAVNYGSNPALGLPASTTIDPSGLNLTASNAYEAAGTGYLRPTSSTSAGGSTTTYSYYGANDTTANPCVTGSTPAYQAGMLETVTDPSPDGTTPGKTVTNIYDEAGNIVATQTNSDGWDCKQYDARGRIIEEDVPESEVWNVSRTITYNYSVNGDPLDTLVTTSDYGTTETITDILGRTYGYIDANGDYTNTFYDDLGRVTEKTGPQGDITYSYDNYNRLISEEVDGTDMADISYDQYGRMSSVGYPDAGSLREDLSYDSTTGRQNSLSYTTAGGSITTDSAMYSQSGKVSQETFDGPSATINSNYTYDTAGRLTDASIGSDTYSYSYGAEDASCDSLSGNNPDAGMNGNRTAYTVDGSTTTYCYNYADQLIASSDANYNDGLYDARGNVSQIGDAGTYSYALWPSYDASDRVNGISQGDEAGDYWGTQYSRDAASRLMYREYDYSNSDGSNYGSFAWYYGYSDSSNAPTIAMDTNFNVIEKDISLPGGLTLTIHPQDTNQASEYSYNLPNLHGDTFMTADGTGTDTSSNFGPNGATYYVYDPFGNPDNGMDAYNQDDGSWGWEGSHEIFTEDYLSPQSPMVMGARLYLPGIGRFISMDPVPGGNANAYTYPLDPVNFSDITGLYGIATFYLPGGLQGGLGVAFLQPAAPVSVYQSTISTARAQAAAGVALFMRTAQAQSRAQAPVHHEDTLRYALPSVATVNGTPLTKIASPPVMGPPENFDITSAGGTAVDYYAAGELIGGSLSCIAAAIFTGGTACIPAGEAGAAIGGPVGGFIGWFAGGYHAPGSDTFSWGPDQTRPWPWER